MNYKEDARARLYSISIETFLLLTTKLTQKEEVDEIFSLVKRLFKDKEQFKCKGKTSLPAL